MFIDMRQVHLKRDGKTIIDEINWQVNAGQHWVILGMNGAGKTTLLNLVCGYLYPTKGTIKVFDKEFGRYPLNEIRKDIGWVSFSLSEKMKHHTLDTGLEIILSGKYASIGLYENPNEGDIEEARAIMGQLSIQRLQNQSFESMSQGEKQRVLIGRALMASPKLLILDEPCSGLDFLSKEQLLTTVKQMAEKREATILYVTHQIDEILPVFTHTLLLQEGRTFSQGPTDEQITSEKLSDFCKVPVEVNRRNGRYFLELNSHVNA